MQQGNMWQSGNLNVAGKHQRVGENLGLFRSRRFKGQIRQPYHLGGMSFLFGWHVPEALRRAWGRSDGHAALKLPNRGLARSPAEVEENRGLARGPG
jgi:hypothetical protein